MGCRDDEAADHGSTIAPCPVTGARAVSIPPPLADTGTPVPITGTPVPTRHAPVPITHAPLISIRSRMEIRETPVPITRACLISIRPRMEIIGTPVPITHARVISMRARMEIGGAPVPITGAPVPITDARVISMGARMEITHASAPITRTPAIGIQNPRRAGHSRQPPTKKPGGVASARFSHPSPRPRRAPLRSGRRLPPAPPLPLPAAGPGRSGCCPAPGAGPPARWPAR